MGKYNKIFYTFIHLTEFTEIIFYRNKFSKKKAEFLVAIKFRIKEHHTHFT